MKHLQIYNKLNSGNNETEIFEYFMNHLTDSIFTWEYFVNFEKAKENIHLIEKELNLLNVLIGKSNVEQDFLNLVEEYPVVRRVLPILIAIRQNKLNELKIISDYDTLTSESKTDLFNPKKVLDSKSKDDLLMFFKESGLKDLFQDKDVKNIVDYCFGIEVGMDTNARKNRTGQSMENIVEKIISKFSKLNNCEYIAQATKSKIDAKWGCSISIDKSNRIFDFAIYNISTKKLFIVETNFYGGGGSKLKSTAGEYQYLHDFLNNQQIDLIWVTDGLGWKTTRTALYETFLHNKYLFNLELLKKGVLEEVIR